MNIWRKLGAWTLAGCAVAALPWAAQGQTFPERAVTLLVPFTPAGPTDSLARTLANALREPLGQSVIVENRAGAGGNIGTVHVVRSRPDGYTLLFGSSGPLAINTALYKNAGFDPLTDFTPIAYVGEIPNVLVVNPALPVQTLPEFVEYARKGGTLSFASSGSGSTNHLAGEMFNRNVGTQLMHIPYKGTAPALTDLLGGQVTMMYLDVLTAAPHIRTGKLRALGVASERRSRILPEVPTFGEQGVPSMNQGVAFGVVGPANLPEDVVAALSRASQAALQSPEMQAALAKQGVETLPEVQDHQAFGELLRRQVAGWRSVVEASGAALD